MSLSPEILANRRRAVAYWCAPGRASCQLEILIRVAVRRWGRYAAIRQLARRGVDIAIPLAALAVR
jgi:hypothetical protein